MTALSSGSFILMIIVPELSNFWNEGVMRKVIVSLLLATPNRTYVIGSSSVDV